MPPKPVSLPAGFVSPRPIPPPIGGPGEGGSGGGANQNRFIPRKPTSERADRPLLRKTKSTKNQRDAVLKKAASDIKFEGKSFVHNEHIWNQHNFNGKPTWCDTCEGFLWQDVLAYQCSLCFTNTHEQCVKQEDICQGSSGEEAKSKKKIRSNTLDSDMLAKKMKYTRLLEDDMFADVFFDYGNGNHLPAHSFILHFRCPKLAGQIEDLRKKAGKGFFKQKKEHTPVHLNWNDTDNISLTSMQFVLNFLYSDNEEFQKIALMVQPSQIAEIWLWARTWELQRLERLMIQRHSKVLNNNTVFELLKGAHKVGAGPLKEQCMAFAHGNLQGFLSQKDKTTDLGMDLFQEVVEAFYDGKVAKAPDPGPIPGSTLIADLETMYAKVERGEEYSDGFVEIGGKKIHFNKAILAANSKLFTRELKPSVLPENCTQALGVESLNASAFQSLLKFFYFGDSSFSAIDSCNLISFCKRFELVEVLAICERQMRDNLTYDVVLDILAVVFGGSSGEEHMKMLEKSALDFAVQNLEYLDLTSLRKMDQELSSRIMYRLLTQLQIAPPPIRITRKEVSVQAKVTCLGVVGESVWLTGANGLAVHDLQNGSKAADIRRASNQSRCKAIIHVYLVGKVWVVYADGEVQVFNDSTRQMETSFPTGHCGHVMAAVLAPFDSQQPTCVWTAGADGVLNVFHGQSLEHLSSVQLNEPILSMCFDGMGMWLGSKGKLGVVPFQTMQPSLQELSGDGRVTHMLHIPTTKEIWCFCSSGDIVIHSAKSQKHVKTLSRHRDKFVAVAFVDGIVWSCSADSVMICWKARTYETLRTLRGVLSAVPVDAVCTSSSPATIWTSTKNNKICIYKKD